METANQYMNLRFELIKMKLKQPVYLTTHSFMGFLAKGYSFLETLSYIL